MAECEQTALCSLLGVGVQWGVGVQTVMLGVDVCEPGGGCVSCRSAARIPGIVEGCARFRPLPERNARAQVSSVGIVPVGVGVASAFSLL